MSIIKEKIQEIENLLLEKAARRSAIRYAAIFKLFEPDTQDNDVWDTFEEACLRIAPSKVAIYGALMATKKTNLPASGFFDIFKNFRYVEFMEITNGQHLAANQLTVAQMQAIAQSERERVHSHAVQIT